MGLKDRSRWNIGEADTGHTLHCSGPLVLSMKLTPLSNLPGGSQPHSIKYMVARSFMKLLHPTLKLGSSLSLYIAALGFLYSCTNLTKVTVTARLQFLLGLEEARGFMPSLCRNNSYFSW